MRSSKLTLSSLALLLGLCGPALAQSPSASQYEPCVPGTEGSVACVQEVGAAAPAFADNAGQGTDAVNDALTGTASSVGASAPAGASVSAASTSVPGGGPVSTESNASESASESASPGSNESAGAAEGTPAARDVEGGSTKEGLASITELPETSGIHPLLPGVGVLLVAFGLMIRRAVL